MSMRALRGLEMVCLTTTGHFQLTYGGGGAYLDPKGEPVKDLMDMGCVACSARFYTREKGAILFCPACGFFERKKFKSFQDLQRWSNEQNWGYLKINGMKPFGVSRHDEWRMVFETDRIPLEMSGHWDEIHDLLAAPPPPARAAAPPRPAAPSRSAPSTPASTPAPAPAAAPKAPTPPGADPRFANLELD